MRGAENNLLYRPVKITKRPTPLPFFLQEDKTRKFDIPLLHLFALRRPLVIDREGNLFLHDGKHPPLSHTGETSYSFGNIASIAKAPSDKYPRHTLGIRLSNGDRYILGMGEDFGRLDRDRKELHPQVLKDSLIIFDEAERKTHIYHFSKEAKETQGEALLNPGLWQKGKENITHFSPGMMGVLYLEKTDGPGYPLFHYTESETGNTFTSKWAGDKSIKSNSIVHKQVRTDIFFTCENKEGHSALYLFDQKLAGKQKINKIADLDGAVQDILPIAKTVFVVYKDNSYSLRDASSGEELLQGDLGSKGDVFLSEQHLFLLDDEKRNLYSYKIKKEESEREGLPLRA